MSSALMRALNRVPAFMAPAEEDWWIFGSAAAALHGVVIGPVRDIDILVSEADAVRMMERHALVNLADGGTMRFSSDIILRPGFGDMPVEVLSGFSVKGSPVCWTPVQPAIRVDIGLDTGSVFVPSRAELAQIARLCGRPRDLQRAEVLER
ncbi:hypothetical protein [Pelagibacterium halotolerans]|uniref:hypothetical protein n=1 Tax=Pelagibacterium halotolerans TaxID=531813 RepID=UPI003851614C